MRSLLDRQQFHDPDGNAEALGISSATWPLFGLLWPTGRVLAHAMVSFELKGRRVLELGCGMALASLVVLPPARRQRHRQRLPPADRGLFAGKPAPERPARHEIPDRALGPARPGAGQV